MITGEYNMENSSQTSFPMNSFLNVTPKPIEYKCVLPLVHGIPIAIINSVLVLVGTFGNLVIIFAVLNTPQLRRKKSNFLLLSLAVADLLVTMLAQPLHTTSISYKTFCNYCVPGVDLAYDITANFSCLSSVSHLSAISIDRALVVTKPHRHHAMMTKYGLKLMLGVCWGVAAVFVCLRVPFPSTLVLSIALIVFNYGIIIVSYAIILFQITREKVISKDPAAALNQASRDAVMEKRVARAIGIIILFFAICWFPLLGFYISVQKAVVRNLSSSVYMWIRTLALSNSSINFLIYSWRIEHFRVAYLKIINRIFQKPRQLVRRTRIRNLPCRLDESVDGSDLEITRNTSSKENANKAVRESSQDLCAGKPMTSNIPAQVHFGTLEEITRRKDQGTSISDYIEASPVSVIATTYRKQSEHLLFH